MKAERKEQERLVTRVFNPDATHIVFIRRAERAKCHLHILVSRGDSVDFPVPQLSEGTEATLNIVDALLSFRKCSVVDVPTEGDVVFAVDKHHVANCVPEERHKIRLVIKPNLMPVKNQIIALRDAS
jgi:hypothetical protein